MNVKKMFGTLTAKFAALAVAVGLAGSVWGDAVARVGSTEYDNIEDAITAWTGANNSTLTLLANVTLPNVVQVKSTEMHTLDLGVYTMTAASGKNAIQVLNYGRTSASYALDIKADATNPGGISAPGYACVYYKHTDGSVATQDRPIIRIYSGVFSGKYCIQHGTSNGTKCPQFWIYGGTFNGTTCALYTNRSLNNIYGGTFNVKNMISPDSSAYTLIQGGKFVDVGNNFGSTLNSGKWTYGTAKGSFNVDVTVDADGYYVVTKPVMSVADKETTYGASLKNTGAGTLAYSNVKTEGRLYYATATRAMSALSNGGDIELYTDCSDNKTLSSGATKMTLKNGVAYTGNVTLSGTSGSFTIIFNKDFGYYGNVTASRNGCYVSLSETEDDGIVTRTYTVQSNTAYNESNAAAAVVSADGSTTNYYGSVYDAFYAVDGNTEGKTIKLLKDVTNASILTNGKAVNEEGKTDVIFDLNGHSFTLQSAGTGNQADYTLTVIDGSAAGTGEVMNNTFSLLKIALTGINDYSGKYTLKVRGGTWHFDPSAVTYGGDTYDVVDEGYVAVKLDDVWKVGKIALDTLQVKEGATETSATYTVPVSLETEEGSVIASLDDALTVSVSVAEGDIADTTLSDIKVDSVVGSAVAAAGGTADSITVEIAVSTNDVVVGENSVSYEVKPEAVVTVRKDATETVSTNELTNADLASGASFTFDLDVTATGVAAGGWVKVTHVSSDYPDETSLCKAKAGANGAIVVTVTTTHFSTFSASPADTEGADAVLLPSVTNTIVSANCFGAISITDSKAATAFVAVPFGAFGVGDSQIAAADVVQAASLSEGDKMYVWNGAAGADQKYEVYKVNANGKWVVDGNKVTVAANGKVTVGSELPDSVTVPTGTGVFIERKDATKPIFVYGQVLTNTVAETTFASGLTLVSPPSTNAMASVDLNALKWTGVGDIETKTTTSGMTIVKSYANADFIYYRNATNAIVRYYHCGGKDGKDGKWGTVIGTWKEAEAAVIPAGTAFWYSKNGAGETKVTW